MEMDQGEVTKEGSGDCKLESGDCKLNDSAKQRIRLAIGNAPDATEPPLVTAAPPPAAEPCTPHDVMPPAVASAEVASPDSTPAPGAATDFTNRSNYMETQNQSVLANSLLHAESQVAQLSLGATEHKKADSNIEARLSTSDSRMKQDNTVGISAQDLAPPPQSASLLATVAKQQQVLQEMLIQQEHHQHVLERSAQRRFERLEQTIQRRMERIEATLAVWSI
eukprot:CAMPEP_0119336476 /NCGR_PEP_ID=MMETSP1333-20130426/91925_1 /TAXON_ID=418940 /ORGANISM="Scyphosphaera apsteinii, Strain RCC1455" /LENGTH=222 /DNA_ID=CAMNT_0007347287 /DNA_START=54 /DNA_END=723 /DNA_ORIENTATION=-